MGKIQVLVSRNASQRLESYLHCPGFDKQETGDLVSLQKEQGMIPPKQHPINNPMAEYIGQFCVVEYDKTLFPGVILDVDEDSVYVKVMHRIGRNHFF